MSAGIVSFVALYGAFLGWAASHDASPPVTEDCYVEAAPRSLSPTVDGGRIDDQAADPITIDEMVDSINIDGCWLVADEGGGAPDPETSGLGPTPAGTPPNAYEALDTTTRNPTPPTPKPATVSSIMIYEVGQPDMHIGLFHALANSGRWNTLHPLPDPDADAARSESRIVAFSFRVLAIDYFTGRMEFEVSGLGLSTETISDPPKTPREFVDGLAAGIGEPDYMVLDGGGVILVGRDATGTSILMVNSPELLHPSTDQPNDPVRIIHGIASDLEMRPDVPFGGGAPNDSRANENAAAESTTEAAE